MAQHQSGGGWQAIRYATRLAFKVGPLRFYKAMHSKNACKTCAFGMGGQLGGMRNEEGRFPEVCKKSMQAMAADMRGKIEPRFFSTYSLAQMRSFSSRELEALGRLTDPVIAEPGDGHYRPIPWEEAFDKIAASLRSTPPERAFFYASGRSSNEAGFLLQLFARAYGTNHVNNCSYYCHQASGVGLKDSIGTGTATIELEDLDKCDLIFVFGGNPASNHPRFMTKLIQVRARGGHVVIVNPLREVGLERFRVPSNVRSLLFASEVASVYLQPTIGGDIALCTGIAKRLLELCVIDQDFVADRTESYESLKEHVEAVSWEQIESASGLTRSQIEDVADLYARSDRTVFSWTMGITHHEHGTENVQWIANLALLRGMIGREGAGLLPIRGHSNVQGIGTVGVTPAISAAAVKNLESIGLNAPAFQGHDTMSTMEAAERGEMSFGVCLGGNLFGANPDASFAASALAKLDTVVYLSTALNTGHTHGLGKTTLILPVLVRDEEEQSTTQESMFNYVRLSDGGPRRYAGPRSETEILSEIARRVLVSGPLDWAKLADHEEIRSLVAKLIPNMEQMESIGRTKQEFHIPGRVMHGFPSSPADRQGGDGAFPTPSGRAAFRAHSIPAHQSLKDGELRLMTIRSEGQFNTVVYEEEDIYRGQERRDVILMNVEDIERLGLSVDQWVEVASESGVMRVLVRAIDIAPGCAAMYYPEANILVGRKVDPRSKTPAFKSTVVTVTPSDRVEEPEPAEAASIPRGRRNPMKAC